MVWVGGSWSSESYSDCIHIISAVQSKLGGSQKRIFLFSEAERLATNHQIVTGLIPGVVSLKCVVITRVRFIVTAAFQ